MGPSRRWCEQVQSWTLSGARRGGRREGTRFSGTEPVERTDGVQSRREEERSGRGRRRRRTVWTRDRPRRTTEGTKVSTGGGRATVTWCLLVVLLDPSVNFRSRTESTRPAQFVHIKTFSRGPLRLCMRINSWCQCRRRRSSNNYCSLCC